MLSAEALINDEDENVPNLSLQKKTTASKMSYFLWLQIWPQCSQNDHNIEDCDYDHIPHKNILFS